MNSCLPGTTRFTQFPACCLFLRLGAFFTMEFALILSGRSRSSALSSFLSVHHIVSGGLVLTHVTRVSLLEGLTQPSGRVRLTEYLSIYSNDGGCQSSEGHVARANWPKSQSKRGIKWSFQPSPWLEWMHPISEH